MERAIGEAEQHDAYLKGRHATYLERQLAAFARGIAKMPELPIVASDASLRWRRVRERGQRAASCVWRLSVSAAAPWAAHRHLIYSALFSQLGCCVARSESLVPLSRGLRSLAADFPTSFPISLLSVRRLVWSRRFFFGSSRSVS